MSYLEKRDQIDALKEQIESYGPISAGILNKINYKFRLDWNYYSNSMEGNTLTKTETRSVMVGNLTVGGKPIKDVLEMKGHNDVIEEILKVGRGQARLSEKRICDIHKGIMHEEDKNESTKIGKWKEKPNYLINYKNEKFDFIAPIDVPQRMHALIDKTNAAIDSIQAHKKNHPHPVDVALQFHLDYVLIHPFYDGNGRTARILTNLLLISFGYPPFWVKEAERSVYNQYIADIQGYGGKPDLFFEFVADLILRSQKIIVDAIEGRSIDEADDLDKRVAMLDRLMEGMDEEIQVTFNQEVLDQMIPQLAEPLIKSLHQKATKVSSLFSHTELSYQLDGNGWSSQSLEFLHHKMKNDLPIRALIHDINFEIRFHKLKKLGVKAFDERVNLHIKFDTHKYQITADPGDIKRERLYHQIPSEDQFNEIASEIIDALMSRIEGRVNEIQKQRS